MRPSRSVAKKPGSRKTCPKCSAQIPIASKHCTCGHRFRKLVTVTASLTESPSDTVKRRRTERIHRSPPDYYVVTHQQNFKRRRRTVSHSFTQEESTKKKKAKAAKALKVKQEEKKKEADASSDSSSRESRESKEEDVYTRLPAERARQYAIILAEINRKFTVQNFRPS